MELIAQFPSILFRKGSPKKELLKKEREKRSENEKYLYCRVCENKITKLTQRAIVQGAFEHDFLNPTGKVFRIGCFQDAWGCLNTGVPSAEWSWFKGYLWQISTCRQCMLHLGWYFSDHKKSDFYGLILDTLI